ncbi:MAG: hypothetical protein ACKVOR_10005 [Flavobacteriales bacterium]
MFFAIAAHAQPESHGQLQWNVRDEPYTDTVWIVTGFKTLNENFKKWKFDFLIDARTTLLSSTPTSLGGLRLGMEYRRVHRFGLGFYGLNNEVITTSLAEVDTSIAAARLSMNYASLFYERVLFFNPKWEWSATVHLGAGAITGSYRFRDSDQWISYENKRTKPLELSTTGYFHLNWWISFGAGVGYRYMRKTPVEVRDVYSAPVALFKVRLKLVKLTRSIWNKDVKNEY